MLHEQSVRGPPDIMAVVAAVAHYAFVKPQVLAFLAMRLEERMLAVESAVALMMEPG